MPEIPPPGTPDPCPKKLVQAIFLTSIVMVKMLFGKLPKTW